MRAAALVLVLVTPATAAIDTSATRRREPTCQVPEYGIWEPGGPSSRVPDSGSYSGVHFETPDIVFTQHTRVIASEVGTSFGMRYAFHDLGATTKLTWRVTFPRPIKGRRLWEYTFTDTPTSGELTGHVGYTFDEDFERVPGAWKFEALADGRAACTMQFTVK